MIKKAIIPVAGKGTRFLPVTKIVCKTLFPIINKPTIQYLIEELEKANVNEVIIVINDEQTDIVDYFDLNSNYYKNLKKEYKELNELQQIIENLKISFVVQKEPKGLGDAILCCKDLIGSDDFAVLLGDDLVLPNGNEVYGIGDLIEKYNSNPAYYIGVKKVKEDETKKYGIVKVDKFGGVMKVIDMVEKPQSNPPSNFAGVGRYILRNNVFEYLLSKPYDGIHEVQLTDAFIMACKQENVYAFPFRGTRYDVGDHAGYVKANIAKALEDDTINEEILKFIEEEMKRRR